MNLHQQSPLWARLTLPFVVFVAIGSLALVAVLQTIYRRQSQQEFQSLARANEQFLLSVRIPPSEQLADQLSRVLNLEVSFRRADGEFIPQLSPERAPVADSLRRLEAGADRLTRLEPRREAVAVDIGGGTTLVLVREAPSASRLLLRPATLAVLAVFWLLAVALGVLIGRRLVAPYLQTRELLAEERQRREKAERLTLLGRMATALAHEIQNPVTAIRMHAQLLESAAPNELPAAVAGSAPAVEQEAGRIEALVNQWMFLARPEPPRTSLVDLAELMRGVVRDLTPLAGHARVRLACACDGRLPVRADQRRLVQAIRNVAVNAIQAMPNGGPLRIEGGRADDRVRLVFQDAGPGFSAGALARCPELFYSEREGGMGIGLAVTREILRAHGGELHLANAAAGGARVEFDLPAAEESL